MKVQTEARNRHQKYMRSRRLSRDAGQYGVTRKTWDKWYFILWEMDENERIEKECQDSLDGRTAVSYTADAGSNPALGSKQSEIEKKLQFKQVRMFSSQWEVFYKKKKIALVTESMFKSKLTVNIDGVETEHNDRNSVIYQLTNHVLTEIV